MRYKLIANPAARRGDAKSSISRAMEILGRKGIDRDLELTAGPGEAGVIARAACRDFDVIVAVGGDGTVNEVVQGMVSSGKPLGVIPCGSGNDFVKSLVIPANIDAAIEILLKGETKVIDAGAINGRFFANGVGIGFDAAVAVASRSLRRLKGLSLYLAALVKALGAFSPASMSITMNGSTIRQDVFMLTIGNGTTCGGGFMLTPHAKLDDGLLDATVVKPMGVLSILRYLPDVFRGTIDHISYAAMHKAPSLKIEIAGTAPIHVDGEIFFEGASHLEIKVVPKALTVIGNFAS